MDTSLSDIKDLVAIAKPFIDPIISTIIKPRIEKLAKLVKKQEQKQALVSNALENKFEQFIARTYAYCVNMNILIFQNQQIKIHDIYYPLTIASSKDYSRYKIKNENFDFISMYQKVLISDTAGMGKSTLTKWISCQLIEKHQAIPILIELRNLKENHNVLDEIYLQINQLDNAFDNDLILSFLELGNFVILFDGFDEIQPKNQELIIKGMRDFISKAPSNQFILTSRPEGALSSFGDFQLFNIVPLRPEESFELIEKYDSISLTKIADKLIPDIKTNLRQTVELLQNPFLVSLIYYTYAYNKDIPSKKITFYEEIYFALFKRHDLSKDGWTRQKKSKLDIQHFKVVLRQLAFDTAIEGLVVYSESEIIDFIDKSKIRCGRIDFSTVDFLDDLLSAVPLFQRDGSQIKWAHKSLQDYFAADFIAFDSRKEDIISRIYRSNRDGFLNILDLFFELDPKTFRNSIIKPIISDYISYHDRTYRYIKDVAPEQIEYRILLTFDREIVIHKTGTSKFQNEGDELKGSPREKAIEMMGDNVGPIVSVYMPGYSIYTSQSFKRDILTMMATKGFSYLHSKDRIRRRSNAIEEFDRIKIGVSELTLVDDAPDSLLNSSSDFLLTNQFLFECVSPKTTFWADYKKFIEELTLINREISNEKRLDNFLDI